MFREKSVLMNLKIFMRMLILGEEQSLVRSKSKISTKRHLKNLKSCCLKDQPPNNWQGSSVVDYVFEGVPSSALFDHPVPAKLVQSGGDPGSLQ